MCSLSADGTDLHSDEQLGDSVRPVRVIVHMKTKTLVKLPSPKSWICQVWKVTAKTSSCKSKSTVNFSQTLARSRDLPSLRNSVPSLQTCLPPPAAKGTPNHERSPKNLAFIGASTGVFKIIQCTEKTQRNFLSLGLRSPIQTRHRGARGFSHAPKSDINTFNNRFMFKLRG